jgi:hypothetical protein
MPVTGFGDPTAQPRKKYSSDPKTRARELVAEGKFGGRQPGAGRRRKPDSQKPKRASAAIAQAARDNADKIASVFTGIVNDDDASRHIKMRAAKLAVDIEGREAERVREEDDRLGRSRADLPEDRDALVSALAEKVAANPVLAAQLGAVLTAAAERAGIPSKAD